jgi:imidazolonepropionase-like amidohydrolase
MRLLAGLLCFAIAAWAGGGSVLLRNGTVHPVSGPEIAGASVLVEDGRITAVGKNVKAPRGVKVVDVKGLHVYPGLVDSGTQIGLSEIGAVRETSDTRELGDFNPQLRALVAVNPATQHVPVVRANGITSVVTGPTGGIISGQVALVHLNGWTWEEMRVRETAALAMQFPVLRIRSGRRSSRDSDAPKTFKEAEQRYRENLHKVSTFFEEARRYEKAKAAGLASFRPDVKYETMLPVLKGETPLAVTAVRKREIRAALDFAAKEKLRIILVQPRQVEDFLEEIKEKEIPIVLGPTLDLPLEEDDSYDASYALPVQIHNAGIKFSFASVGNQFARNLPYQASMAAAFGLPKDVALKSVTLHAAEIWGADDLVGSIEEGKLGDLIVTDGDPLETRTQIKRIFVAGEEIDPTANKHYELYQKYKDRM